MAGRHIGVMCDGCSTSAFSGKRYKCTICDDYDLCELCQSSGVRSSPEFVVGSALLMRPLVQVLTKDHARDHMMTEILPPGGNLVGAFGGASSRGRSATCTYAWQISLASSLASHARIAESEDSTKVDSRSTVQMSTLVTAGRWFALSARSVQVRRTAHTRRSPCLTRRRPVPHIG